MCFIFDGFNVVQVLNHLCDGGSDENPAGRGLFLGPQGAQDVIDGTGSVYATRSDTCVPLEPFAILGSLS